jgi:hypothetical protein
LEVRCWMFIFSFGIGFLLFHSMLDVGCSMLDVHLFIRCWTFIFQTLTFRLFDVALDTCPKEKWVSGDPFVPRALTYQNICDFLKLFIIGCCTGDYDAIKWSAVRWLTARGGHHRLHCCVFRAPTGTRYHVSCET